MKIGLRAFLERNARIIALAFIIFFASVSIGLADQDQDHDQDTRLWLAVNDNSIERVLEAINQGANVNNTSGLGGNGRTVTPLLWEASRDSYTDISILRALLEHGANVNVKDSDGMTALMHLCDRDNVSVDAITLLLEITMPI